MSGLKTNTEISTGKSQSFPSGDGDVKASGGRCAPGEFWGRGVIVAACLAAITVIWGTGCGSGVRPACVTACALVGLPARATDPLDFGNCYCVPAHGAAADGGAR